MKTLLFIIIVLFSTAITTSTTIPSAVATTCLASSHTCALTNDGKVYCWGWALSHATNYQPTLVTTLPPVQQLTCGFGKIGVILADSLLPAMVDMYTFTVTMLTKNTPASYVGFGSQSGVFLTMDGVVYAFGANYFGFLGQENQVPSNIPLVVNLDNSKRLVTSQLSAGYNFVCALMSFSSTMQTAGIKCWGQNSFGQLGQMDTNNRGDAPFTMGDYLPLIDLGSGRTPVHVIAGYSHACAIVEPGNSMVCWGDNRLGQLGTGNTIHMGNAPGTMGQALIPHTFPTTIRDISIGFTMACAMLDDGTSQCWGTFGPYAFEGLLPQQSSLVPVAMTVKFKIHDLAMFYMIAEVCFVSGGSVRCAGNNQFGGLGLGWFSPAVPIAAQYVPWKNTTYVPIPFLCGGIGTYCEGFQNSGNGNGDVTVQLCPGGGYSIHAVDENSTDHRSISSCHIIPCPDGMWASPGAIGASSCFPVPVMSKQHVEMCMPRSKKKCLQARDVNLGLSCFFPNNIVGCQPCPYVNRNSWPWTAPDSGIIDCVQATPMPTSSLPPTVAPTTSQAPAMSRKYHRRHRTRSPH